MFKIKVETMIVLQCLSKRKLIFISNQVFLHLHIGTSDMEII